MIPDTYIGKKQVGGVMRGGSTSFIPSAQIFIVCKSCKDTISILPDRKSKRSANSIIDSISNDNAVCVFELHGWKFGDGSNICCPKCLTLNQ